MYLSETKIIKPRVELRIAPGVSKHMKRHLQITIIILTFIVSCKQKENKNVESSQQKPTTELNTKTEQSVQKNKKGVQSNSFLIVIKIRNVP